MPLPVKLPTMPGRFFLTSDVADISARLGADRGEIDVEPPRLDIAPGTDILVCDETRRLRRMRWGIVPVGRKNARGRPEMKNIINARSETVFQKSVFDGLTRCIVPVDGWYEWTGEKRKKSRWRIRAISGELLMFAAIYDVWKGPGGVELPQVATLTCEPNETVRKIHHRMGVILSESLWAPWLRGDDIPMDPAPEDLLVVEDASELDKKKGPAQSAQGQFLF